MEVGIAHQAGAEREVPDLAFEVLDLVEVAGPMQRSLRDAAVAAEGDGVAQAFAELGEVPDAAVLPAVVVAAGATDVLLEGHAIVACVVEELFSAQHLGAEFFRRHAIQHDGRGRRRLAAVGQRVEVVNGDGAIHEVVNEKRPAIRREHQPLRRAAGVEAQNLLFGPGVGHRHFAAAFQRGEEEVAVGIEGGGAGDAGVVEIDPAGEILGCAGQLDARGDAAHGHVVRERRLRCAACRA